MQELGSAEQVVLLRSAGPEGRMAAIPQHPTELARLARHLSFSVCARPDSDEDDSSGGGSGDAAGGAGGAAKQTGDDLLMPPPPPPPPPPAAAPGTAPVRAASVPEAAEAAAAAGKKISVCLRIRPPTQAEQAAGEVSCIGQVAAVGGSQSAVTFNPPRSAATDAAPHSSAHRVTSETYHFDTVFDGSAGQDDVYDRAAKRLVGDLTEGKSGLIFAFGITNAGKTHTVHGSDDDPGLLPRAIEQLFDTRLSDEHALSMSYMEVYNDNVFDLLCGQPHGDAAGAGAAGKASRSSKRVALQLKEDERGRVFVKGLSSAPLQSVAQSMELLAKGRRARQAGFTATNDNSSRSHSIVTIKLQLSAAAAASELVVVDLAGSERTGRTKNTGLRLKESARINSSLMNLGRCLEVLRANQQLSTRAAGGAKRAKLQVVPFRESKITRVLQAPLMATDTNVVMICNIYAGAKDAEETVHALRYAAIARDVVTGSAIAMHAQRTTRFVNGAFGGRAKLAQNKRRAAAAGSSSLAAVEEQPATVSEADPDGTGGGGGGGQAVSSKRQEELAEELEEEIRNELAEEMEATIEEMEQSYRDKLARETAIYEAKFEHKLKLLTRFEGGGGGGGSALPATPEDLVAMLEELEQLRSENAALGDVREQHAAQQAQIAELMGQEQAARRELAAMSNKTTAEQEEHMVQCETNMAMEVETLEFQLDQSTKEGDRLREEIGCVNLKYSEMTTRLIAIETAKIDAERRVQSLEQTLVAERMARVEAQRSDAAVGTNAGAASETDGDGAGAKAAAEGSSPDTSSRKRRRQQLITEGAEGAIFMTAHGSPASFGPPKEEEQAEKKKRPTRHAAIGGKLAKAASISASSSSCAAAVPAERQCSPSSISLAASPSVAARKEALQHSAAKPMKSASRQANAATKIGRTRGAACSGAKGGTAAEIATESGGDQFEFVVAATTAAATDKLEASALPVEQESAEVATREHAVKPLPRQKRAGRSKAAASTNKSGGSSSSTTPSSLLAVRLDAGAAMLDAAAAAAAAEAPKSVRLHINAEIGQKLQRSLDGAKKKPRQQAKPAKSKAKKGGKSAGPAQAMRVALSPRDPNQKENSSRPASKRRRQDAPSGAVESSVSPVVLRRSARTRTR
eukprot:SAG22_NODE_485_length_9905_cov_35.562003_2_plen_1142_part_00